MELNPQISGLPKHLKQYIVDQHYENYTPIDQAVWRYVMRQNVRFLQKVAHESYLSGLEKAGIDIERIPSVYGMNRILKKIGWSAVNVDGFIPPNAFMEFQAHKVLVIASDIRQINHIEYTPAPDIIHEAAGHAPIIADPEYAQYLIRFGEIGSKAFSSTWDQQMYEAVRHLSIIKEFPGTTDEEIEEAEARLEELKKNKGEMSEMSQIRNLHWWTVEYGLIGTLEKYRIYGAGLLSSIGESYSSFSKDVKKIPLSIDAANFGFDITTRQPQLFVAQDFMQLNAVLEEFAKGMAVNVGGAYGMRLAEESQNVATVVLNTGLSITGVFSGGDFDEQNVWFVRSTAPTAFALAEKELDGHSSQYHKDGFSSPIGTVNQGIQLEHCSDADLKEMGIVSGMEAHINFDSGYELKGKLIGLMRNDEGQLMVLTFEDCQVMKGETILFQPEWGNFDLVVGSKVVSVYQGAADADCYYEDHYMPEEKTMKVVYSDHQLRLHQLYQIVRSIREDKKELDELGETWQEIMEGYPEEWLLPIEILELINGEEGWQVTVNEILGYLEGLMEKRSDLTKLITDGLELMNWRDDLHRLQE